MDSEKNNHISLYIINGFVYVSSRMRRANLKKPENLKYLVGVLSSVVSLLIYPPNEPFNCFWPISFACSWAIFMGVISLYACHLGFNHGKEKAFTDRGDFLSSIDWWKGAIKGTVIFVVIFIGLTFYSWYKHNGYYPSLKERHILFPLLLAVSYNLGSYYGRKDMLEITYRDYYEWLDYVDDENDEFM